MIKRADDRDFYPNLTAAKPRATGINPISRLVELLIKQYEIQDEMRKQNRKPSQTKKRSAIAEIKTNRTTQATFAWFE